MLPAERPAYIFQTAAARGAAFGYCKKQAAKSYLNKTLIYASAVGQFCHWPQF